MEDYHSLNLIPVEVEISLRGSGIKFTVDGYEEIEGTELVRWHFYCIEWDKWSDELRVFVKNSVYEYCCLENVDLVTAITNISNGIAEELQSIE